MHRIAVRVFSNPGLYSIECTSNLINIRLNLLSDSTELNTKFIFDGDFDSIKDIDALKMQFFNYILGKFGVSIGSSVEMYKGSLIVNCVLDTDTTTMRNIFDSMLKSPHSILPGFNLSFIEQFDERYLFDPVKEGSPEGRANLFSTAVGAIVGGVIAAVVVVAILAAAGFVYIKKRLNPNIVKGLF